jgi:2-amino-4-hydroxy-6-hydroxymethyldihydropteridine diphosphokinase
LETKRPTSVYLGLGSNLGRRRAAITAALGWLAQHPRIALRRHSGLIETEPWGVSDQPRFINAVVEIETSLPPRELLEQLKSAERALGRRERKQKWGPREIDIDILLYGDEVIDEATLTIPHPCLTERAFVIRQLLELDNALKHPALKVPLSTFIR